MKKKEVKKYILWMVILLAFVSIWKIYQNNIPLGMKNWIISLEERKDEIEIYDGSNNITDEFFYDNHWNYKLGNWKFIFDDINENYGSLVVSDK